MSRSGWRILALLAAASMVLLSLAAIAGAARHRPPGFARPHGAAARQRAQLRALRASGGAPSPTHTPDDGDLADQRAQYDYERTAPATSVSGAATVSAYRQARALPSTPGTWQEITTKPYNGEPAGYTDPFWSNVGAGFSLVGGRTTALAQTPSGNWFAGTADGGVWRSTNRGGSWTPVFDGMPSLSIGAVAVNPVDGSLWVGTGEANTSSDSYAGTGVYRSTNDGQSFTRVGNDSSPDGNPLVSRTVFQLAFDPSGDAYAATNNGLFRYSPSTGQWTEVLDPAGPTDNPPYDQQTTTVAVVPRTGGRDVITAIGWHGPGNTQNNGFYESTDGGHTFAEVTPTGDINAADIGRTTFAYSRDGKKLYAIVQSLAALAAGSESVLQGIYSASGSPANVAGSWTKIADEAKLANSGSALAVGSGYGVGVQAWYNQDLAVSPTNDNHVYAGLEEVFESTNGGSSWVTASPYWNYGLACNKSASGCPKTTHPDQHAMMIANGKIVIGNDGGVYYRPLADTQQYGGWTDTNATLRSWQYYDGREGRLPQGGGVAVWGGLQDNGTSVLNTGAVQMAEPAGGDGFDVIVDPSNAYKMVGEYTDGTMYSSTDGGHSFYDPVSPGCVAQQTVGITPRPDCDPSFRFAAPLIQDQQNANTWVAGGRYVWVSKAGWNTSCTSSSCSWVQEFDTGAGNAVTALSSANDSGIVYAGWVSGGNPGPSFARGIATNYGGTWHQVNTTGLPNRFIAGMTADPSNPAHAYAIFNGYSRRWVPGGGVGHVWETFNGGQTWQDVSGNLPDIASDAMVLAGGKLALATDQGMFVAREGQGTSTSWFRLGHGLPNASVNNVTPGPGGRIYAATHGRGIWSIPFPGVRVQTTRHRG
jgi:sugar lactone lactonase YvrE